VQSNWQFFNKIRGAANPITAPLKKGLAYSINKEKAVCQMLEAVFEKIFLSERF